MARVLLFSWDRQIEKTRDHLGTAHKWRPHSRGRGLWKSKGGCVNTIVQISSKCGQGGGCQKSDLADVIHGWLLHLVILKWGRPKATDLLPKSFSCGRVGSCIRAYCLLLPSLTWMMADTIQQELDSQKVMKRLMWILLRRHRSSLEWNGRRKCQMEIHRSGEGTRRSHDDTRHSFVRSIGIRTLPSQFPIDPFKWGSQRHRHRHAVVRRGSRGRFRSIGTELPALKG